MIETGHHQVIVWDLKPEGTCGVGDHSRLFVRHLGGQIVDVGAGQAPARGPQLIQYTPVGWTERAAWIGNLVSWLDAHPTPDRTLFLHEVRRRLSPDPRMLWPWMHDLLALRMMLPRANRILVTTEHRARMVKRLLAAWRLDVPVGVVAVCSNVHGYDPRPADMTAAERNEHTVCVFARSTGGVLGAELGRTIAEVLRRRPATRVLLLGDRGFVAKDDLVGTLANEGVADRVTITGMLPAADVASHLSRAAVGLALHDTGVSGRRGTVSAMLAAGVPVVTARGEETDSWLEASDAVLISTHARRVNVNATAAAVMALLDENDARKTQRREAAVTTYLQHCSWRALARSLGQKSRAAVQTSLDETRSDAAWVA